MNEEVCTHCGRGGGKIHRMPDGSTIRNVRREQCQPVLTAIFTAYSEADEMSAIECYEELSNDAEKSFVWSVLSTNQRKWMTDLMRTNREQSGWGGE